LDIIHLETISDGVGMEISHNARKNVPGCSPTTAVGIVAGSWPAEYYGLMMSVFADGTPSSDKIEEAMQWMKTSWVAGNKVIWPGWVTLG